MPVEIGPLSPLSMNETFSIKPPTSGRQTVPKRIASTQNVRPDPGSGLTFWVLAILFGTVWRPLVGGLIEKVSFIDNGLKGPISTGMLAAFYVVAWALLHRSNPSLPQDWTSWVLA